VLGNVGVYVDASVDPQTLTHSKAALATALVRQGLVGEAMRGGGDGLPLLRGVTAQTLAGVASEEQVIVFAERVWCLRQLAGTLRERHGVEAHVADGSITTLEFEALKRRFTAGEFPVLCLSRIGHEGHNLQNASVLCHLDLPWLPNGLQRVGRAARPGAAGRGPRAGADLQSRTSVAAGSSTSSPCSPSVAPSTTRSSTASKVSTPPRAPSRLSSDRSLARSPTARDDAGYAATAARLRVAASMFGSW
jgi:superfamily II DNA/RNA helicase